MGSGISIFSQEDYDRYSLAFYEATFWKPCLLPDVGIDAALLKFAGTDSNAVLQSYSDELVNQVPGYVNNLGCALGSMTPFPNAVGLGALVISIIMEICIKSSTERNDDSYGMLQRVFGEEKASRVRDTMSEYVTRHCMYMKNNQQLQLEIQRLEVQLVDHLTSLRNSLLYDGQMSTRGFKIWVNGASFHIQMLIHNARLNTQTGQRASDYVSTIKGAIGTHLQDLDRLLEKYKTHKISTTKFTYNPNLVYFEGSLPSTCDLENDDKGCGKLKLLYYVKDPCNSKLTEHYINVLFSKYEPISSLKSHFLNFQNNLNDLINQNDSFTPPSLR